LTDIVATDRFWGSVLVRYTKQNAFEAIARIPDEGGSPIIPLSRRRMARTSPGDRIEIQGGPRFIVNDYIAFGARWRYLRQEGTTIEETAAASGSGALRYEGPVVSLHEAGIGFSWSSVAAWRRGQAGIPLEIQYERALVVDGTGNAPRFTSDRISLRAYVRLWGN
jgi:hypothetical protein